MTLRGGGGGGWESEGVTLTNQAFLFTLPEKTLEEDHRCCKKALHPKHYAEVLATWETVGEAAADEVEEQEQEEEQQEDTEDSGGESGDDKCMVCGEKDKDVWTLKTGWHVKCVHSGYILSAYPPIIYILYHMQTFIAIFVYSSNFH